MGVRACVIQECVHILLMLSFPEIIGESWIFNSASLYHLNITDIPAIQNGQNIRSEPQRSPYKAAPTSMTINYTVARCGHVPIMLGNKKIRKQLRGVR